MPPKRKAPTEASTSRGKKSKTRASADRQHERPGDESQEGGNEPTQPPAKSRYTLHSGSANLEASYRLRTRDKAEAYSYICRCRSPFKAAGLQDEEDEEEDNAGNNAPRSACDSGTTCICLKPASDHPNHPYMVTSAGLDKFNSMYIMTDLRCPDNFGMYTYNDHEGYGWIEVLENLVLDYEDAGHQKNWKEQWVVCEAMGWLGPYAYQSPMCMTEDGDGLKQLILLIGVMFLDMLYTLERENQLSPTSEVKDLGLVIASFVSFASYMRKADLLEPPDEEDTSIRSRFFKLDATRFDSYAVAYVRKYKIVTLGEVAKIVADCEPVDLADLPLPASEMRTPTGPAANSPWCFEATLASYKADNARSAGKGKPPAIGGNQFDLTSWSAAERKAASFDGKDPLGKKELAALKRGDVLQMG